MLLAAGAPCIIMDIPTVSYANVTSKTTFPKKDQAIIIDSIDGIMLRDYLIALSTVTKPTSIRFISRIANSRVCVYMDTKQTADELVDVIKKVKVKDNILEIRPLITRNKRIVLSNVCPIIPHEVIIEKFNEINIKILSPITFMRVGISEPGFTHIMSFRRQLYVSPEDEKRLPESMQINYDDTNYWIYVTNESMKCFVCNGMGHLAKYCPQSKHQSTQETEEISTYPPIIFNKPLGNLTPLTKNLLFNKGTKRFHSDTTSGTPQPEPIQTIPPAEEMPMSDHTDDTDSNYSLEEEQTNLKSIKKKKKTIDSRSEEQVWNDIKLELKESNISFPLSVDQFISLLDVCRNKQNVLEITKEYTDKIPELIDMCLQLHPKMNKTLKNRCSRFTRKLQCTIEPGNTH